MVDKEGEDMNTKPKKALPEKSDTDPWILTVFGVAGAGVIIIDAICIGVGITVYGLTGWVPPVHDILATIFGIGGLGLAMMLISAFGLAITSDFKKQSSKK